MRKGLGSNRSSHWKAEVISTSRVASGYYASLYEPNKLGKVGGKMTSLYRLACFDHPGPAGLRLITVFVVGLVVR